MRTTLPGVRRNESGIVNLDNAERPGTHRQTQKGGIAIYFDNFGNLRPLKKLVRYLKNNVTQIEYNHMPYQRYDQSNCGQLCLQFLRMADNQFKG